MSVAAFIYVGCIEAFWPADEEKMIFMMKLSVEVPLDGL